MPLMQSALGTIGSNVASGLGVLSYAIYIIPVVIIAFFVWMVWGRKKQTGAGENLAIIYSIRHRTISDIKPFMVARKFDAVKNVEETKAIFPSDNAKKGNTGLIGVIMGLIGGKPKEDPSNEEGAIFSEALAVYNQAKRGWLTIYSLETYTQLPLVSGNTDILAKMVEMERNVERRVSRLKSSQLAIQSYVSTSTPIESLNRIQLISFILIFIGIIALAYALIQIGDSVNALSAALAALKGLSVASTGGAGTTTIASGGFAIFMKRGEEKKNAEKEKKRNGEKIDGSITKKWNT